jgi:hypothetical protein
VEDISCRGVATNSNAVLLCQYSIEHLRSLQLQTRHYVAVGIQRDADLRVPKAFLNHLGVDASGEQKNEPLPADAGDEAIAGKINRIERGVVPLGVDHVTAFIDSRIACAEFQGR